MIRVDEIYDNVMWPWLMHNRPGTRLFFCDPPGVTTPDALLNHGNDHIEEKDYVFCHDQEPMHLDIHQLLFDEVVERAWSGVECPQGHLIVSEKGLFVDEICAKYNWKNLYYFYHGWAALDWYRGYDRTFLIRPPNERVPSRTFISPNRIIGGKRDHRILFLYHLHKKNLIEHNWVSAPKICPYENTSILEMAAKFLPLYPDIVDVFANARLPRLFPGEDTQIMTSCWLSNFDLSEDCLIYVPTETVFFGQRTHLTEKTFKPIALAMPFILVAPAGSLSYLREYGFHTFDGIWSEDYDNEQDDTRRLQKVTDLLKELDGLSLREKQHLHRACLDTVEHNFKHFYGGAFESILWQEFTHMLGKI